ncbi:hypothetical protein ACFQ60_16505 [Streptomyces zhihengii]
MTTVTALTARTTDRRGLIGATLLAGAVELVPEPPHRCCCSPASGWSSAHRPCSGTASPPARCPPATGG